jgi:hypothetical protein
LRRLSVPPTTISSWSRRGRVQQAGPGVWRIAGTPDRWEQRLWTGVLSLGRGARISHEAAAQLLGLDRTPPDRVEFTIRRSGRGVRLHDVDGFVVHTTRTLEPRDCVTIEGFPVTSATRTILDLSRTCRDRERLAAAIDSAVRAGLTAPIVLMRRLSTLRGPGRWGCQLLDELLVDAGGHSMLERRFLELVRRAGVPRPKLQQVFRDHGRTLARTDFWWADQLVVVEVSGSKGHASPTERAHDAQRRNELQDAGVRVYEHTWEDVTRRAEAVTAELRRRLGQQDLP